MCVIAWQLREKIKPTSVTIAYSSEKQKAMALLASDDIVYLICIALALIPNHSWNCFYYVFFYLFISILKQGRHLSFLSFPY